MVAFRINRCCSYAALVILICQFNSFAGAGITVSPASQTIVQGTTASFSCVVTNGLGFWMINETWVLPSVDFSTYGFAIAIDQQDDGAVMSIVAEGRASNNNTRITCVSIDNDDSSVTQVDAYLLVAGPPTAPRVSFRLLNSTAIAFSWEKPFIFPNVSDILFYTLRLYSRARSLDRKEWKVPKSSDLSYTHVLTSDAVATACEQLVFEVSATNNAGTSPTQSVTGGFPVVPAEAANDQPEVKIRPTSNGAMTAEVIFQLPRVCSYQSIKYTLYVKQISSANVAQSRQTELIPDGKQTVVSTVVTGLASNLNTLFTVLVQSATGELQFSKMVLKQNLPILKLALSTVVKGNAVAVYPKPTVAVDSMFCRILNFPFQNCSSGQITFNGLPDGEVVIQVVAKSGSEVVSSNVTVWVNQNINFCAPYLNNNMVTVSGGEVSVEFSSSGRPSDYYCALDSGSFIPCSSPFKLKNVTPGRHTLQILPRECPSSRMLSVPFTV
ncbi:hypothetical protein EMCRGX_G011873 [Ephydatia muelleri]